jgi:nicotinamidase-related amidase
MKRNQHLLVIDPQNDFCDLPRCARCRRPVHCEAGSPCVKATIEHIVEQFGPAAARKLVLVTDCMSPVAGFEAQYDAFVRDMLACGAGRHVCRCLAGIARQRDALKRSTTISGNTRSG